MSNEWIDLKDMQAVAEAQALGWEIEVKLMDGDWGAWGTVIWSMDRRYRGRPKQPKKITVTSECWRNKHYGGLFWGSGCFGELWQRFPAGDITGEVEA